MGCLQLCYFFRGLLWKIANMWGLNTPRGEDKCQCHLWRELRAGRGSPFWQPMGMWSLHSAHQAWLHNLLLMSFITCVILGALSPWPPWASVSLFVKWGWIFYNSVIVLWYVNTTALCGLLSLSGRWLILEENMYHCGTSCSEGRCGSEGEALPGFQIWGKLPNLCASVFLSLNGHNSLPCWDVKKIQ